MPITPRSILRDCRWSSKDAIAAGYDDSARMIDWFGPLADSYPSRPECLAAMRAAYLGPDTCGIGIILPTD